MKINQNNHTARRNAEQAAMRIGRKDSVRSSWTEFYTHQAVPAIFAAQECFKQEQR